MAKFTIVKLKTKSGTVYEPGREALDKITYLRDGYNKHYQYQGPVYLLTYDETDVRLLIPQSEATAIHVRKENEAVEIQPEAAVQLPEE